MIRRSLAALLFSLPLLSACAGDSSDTAVAVQAPVQSVAEPEAAADVLAPT
ncbi:MAG TPA: hypothetical protein PLD19_15065 [Luteimonas sp.]|nr:hypothetical protein [Luteimonas sp.]